MIRHHDAPTTHPIRGPVVALIVAVAAALLAPSLTPDGLNPYHVPSADAAPAAQDGSSVIEGFVFLDADEDGLLGAAEQGLSGLTVVLEPEDGEPQTQRTDASGGYRFAGLENGVYTVRLGDAPNFMATGPSVYRGLEFAEDGETLAGVDFGVVERPDAATGDDESEEDEAAEEETADEEDAQEETADEDAGDSVSTAEDDTAAEPTDDADAAAVDEDDDAASEDTDEGTDDDGVSAVDTEEADDDADAEAAGDATADDEAADDEAAVMQMLREDLEEMAASGEMPAGTNPAVAAAMARLEPAEAAAIADAVANDDMAALADAIAMLDDDEAEQLADAVEEAGAPDMADRVRTARAAASEAEAPAEDADEDTDEEAAAAPSPDMPQTGFGDLGGMALLVSIAIIMGLVGGYGLLRERNGGTA